MITTLMPTTLMPTTLTPTTLMPTTLMPTTLMATTRTGSAYTTANLVKCKGEMEKLLADKSLLEETRAWLKKGGGSDEQRKTLRIFEKTLGCYIMESAQVCAVCILRVFLCSSVFSLLGAYTHTHRHTQHANPDSYAHPTRTSPFDPPTPSHPPLTPHP